MIVMSRRKAAVIISLILTLVCCSLIGFAAEKKGPSVSMEVSSVYDTMGKMGVHVPLSVRLTGQSGSVFEGILAIRTLENGEEGGAEVIEYRYPVTIGIAETVEMELDIPLGHRSNSIHVVLMDGEDRTVSSQTMTFDISRDSGRLVIGVLSEKPEQLEYFDRVSLDYGMAETVTVLLDEETLPKTADGLDLLDVLLINSYETDNLSPEQIEAVYEWIDNGGTLLIGTGAMAYSTLGAFAEGIVELPIGGIFYENVNMGAEYAEHAPRDSEVNMACADLVIHNGTVVEESDGIPLLTIVERGSGRIGVFSYDLDEIRDFVDKNPTYINKMLTDILGEEEISMLYYYSTYGNDADYWNAYNLVNTGNADRLPKLGIYAVLVVIYILIAGPGLYVFLKKRGLSHVYGTSVILTSVCMAAVVYMAGTATRFTSQFFTVSAILEMDGIHVKETSFLNARTPNSRQIALSVPAEYEVSPLSRANRYDEQMTSEFPAGQKADVVVTSREHDTWITADAGQAFESRLFELVRNDRLITDGGVTGDLHWENGTVTGTIVNGFSYPLEDAALVLYGQMVLLGDIPAGGTAALNHAEPLVWPVSMSYVAAEKIAGNGTPAEEREHEAGTQADRYRLYTYYLGQSFGSYEPGAKLLAAGNTGGILTEHMMEEEITYGQTLYAIDLTVNPEEEDMIYRSGMKLDPSVTSGSGSFYGDGLTMYGMEPMIVEYKLGTDVEVEELSFLPVSAEFLDDPDYYYLKVFDGTAAFYNNTTKSYDRVNLSGIRFGIEELRPYLTQDNHITVKYSVGNGDMAGSSVLLPHLMVTGRDE